MKNILFLFIFFSQAAWAKVCSLEEIQVLDTKYFGEEYSPYPLMTKVNLVAPLLPVLTHLDATTEENSSFYAVTFVGLGGWIYYGLKTLSSDKCVDPRENGTLYQPTLSEVLKFHQREKDHFMKSYLWSSGWMLGIIATSNYSDRKSAAVISLLVPWLFSLSRKWSAFALDEELQLALVPKLENNKLVFYPSLVWSF